MPAQGKRRTRRKSDLDREFEKLLRRAASLAKARSPQRASSHAPQAPRRLILHCSPAGLPERYHPERLAGSAPKDPSASLHLGQDMPSFAKLARSAPGWCNW